MTGRYYSLMLIRRAAAPAYNVANQKHASTRENEELKNSVLTELGVAAVAVAYGKRAAVSAPRQEACKPSAAQAEACTQEACGTQRVQRGDQGCALGVLQKRCSQNLESVEATAGQDQPPHWVYRRLWQSNLQRGIQRLPYDTVISIQQITNRQASSKH